MSHYMRTREHFQINAAIRELRIQKGMTQEGLAARAGMQGRSVVCRLEKKDGYYPTLPTLLDICKALEIKPSALFARAETITRREREGKKDDFELKGKVEANTNLKYVRMALADLWPDSY